MMENIMVKKIRALLLMLVISTLSGCWSTQKNDYIDRELKVTPLDFSHVIDDNEEIYSIQEIHNDKLYLSVFDYENMGEIIKTKLAVLDFESLDIISKEPTGDNLISLSIAEWDDVTYALLSYSIEMEEGDDSYRVKTILFKDWDTEQQSVVLEIETLPMSQSNRLVKTDNGLFFFINSIDFYNILYQITDTVETAWQSQMTETSMAIPDGLLSNGNDITLINISFEYYGSFVSTQLLYSAEDTLDTSPWMEGEFRSALPIRDRIFVTEIRSEFEEENYYWYHPSDKTFKLIDIEERVPIYFVNFLNQNTWLGFSSDYELKMAQISSRYEIKTRNLKEEIGLQEIIGLQVIAEDQFIVVGSNTPFSDRRDVEFYLIEFVK